VANRGQASGLLDEEARGVDLGAHRPFLEMHRAQLGGSGRLDPSRLRFAMAPENAVDVREHDEMIGFQPPRQKRAGVILVDDGLDAKQPAVLALDHGHAAAASPVNVARMAVQTNRLCARTSGNSSVPSA